jgi:hypothetical protein
VPAGLAPGPYDILVHAASSGAYGWSAPYRVDVVAHRDLAQAYTRPEQASPQEVNLLRVHGAIGDGLHDDARAIQTTLDQAAAAGGGVVLLPPGKYAIAKTLHIEPGVFLDGSGVQATSIIVSPTLPMQGGPGLERRGSSYDKGYLPPMIWIETKSGVSDLSLIGGPGCQIAVYICGKGLSEDVSIVRTNITTPERMFRSVDGNGYQAMFGITALTATRNLTVAGCHIKCGEPIFLDPSTHYGCTITNNTFEVFPRQSTNDVYSDSITHCVIEDNDFIGGARALYSGCGSDHNWIFNNRITDDGGWANAEEMMVSEHGFSLWAGACQSASANTIQAQGAHWPDGILAGAQGDNWYENQFIGPASQVFVFVKLGKGFGQLRRVTGNTADTITIDAPWDIVPDFTSRFAVLQLTYRNLYINDQTIDCNGRCEFAYGGLAECVISGLNTRDSEGISSTAVDGGIVAFNDYSYNRVIGMSGIHLQDGQYWDAGFTQIPGVEIGDNRTGDVIGNTIRNNEVMDFRQYPLNAYFSMWDHPGAMQPASGEAGISLSNGSFNVIDDDYVTSGAVGIRIDGGVGNIVTHSRVDDVSTPIVDNGRQTFTGRSRQ